MNRRTWPVITASLVAGIGMLSCIVLLGFAAGSQASLPKKLAGLSELVQLTPEEIQELKAGRPVSKLLDTGVDHEVAVLGVVWIDALASQYVRTLKDVEQMSNRGGIQMTRRISNQARLEDFAALNLPEEDIEDLKVCRVGYCGVKLDETAIQRIQKEIDWSRATAPADVRALFRQIALKYVTAYQRGGNAELHVYRDKDQPTYVAQEFAKIVDQTPVLRREPALRRYLLEYPKAQLPNAASFFYWQQVKFGLKPTIRMNHVVMTETPEHVLVASKQLYASHYFWTGLELRKLIPDASRGKGFWFVNVNIGRSDGLTGITGRAIGGRVRDEALRALTESMQATKAELERKTR